MTYNIHNIMFCCNNYRINILSGIYELHECTKKPVYMVETEVKQMMDNAKELKETKNEH